MKVGLLWKEAHLCCSIQYLILIISTNHMYNRRNFLKATGTLASGILISRSAFSMGEAFAPTGSINKFGLQLWSVRDDLSKDVKGTLKQLAGYGYKQIEGFEGKQGIFWGMTNKEFKKYMDELGLTFVSTHCDINKD